MHVSHALAEHIPQKQLPVQPVVQLVCGLVPAQYLTQLALVRKCCCLMEMVLGMLMTLLSLAELQQLLAHCLIVLEC